MQYQILNSQNMLRCPECGFECNHLHRLTIDSADERRGEIGAIRLNLYCENAHTWDLLICQHKGAIELTAAHTGQLYVQNGSFVPPSSWAR